MQKKAFNFLIAVVSVAVFILLFLANTSFCLKDFNGHFEVYRFSSSSNAIIISIRKEDMKYILNKTGEGCFLTENIEVDEILSMLSAKVVFTENTENGTSYYAYCGNIKMSKIINNKQINVQIHKSEQGIKIGTPLIYGSF